MREHFLLDPAVVFLNHGSFGACPRTVFDRYQHWQRELERNPVELLARRSAGLLDEVRAELGRLVNASADSLVLVTNATVAVNTVARSLRLEAGDEVLISDQEYGACEAMWELLCRRAGARLVRAEVPLPFDAERFADELLRRVSAHTRIIHVSHVTSSTGIVLPVAVVCAAARSRGVLTLVDGAHGPGQLEVDVAAVGADFYAGNCHKWLCAPKGAGFLHARAEHHDRLDAVVLSWGYGRDSADLAGLLGTGGLVRRHQWQGTRDLAAFLAVPSALAFQREHDWPSVRRRCHELGLGVRARAAELFGLPDCCGPNDFLQMAAVPVPPCEPTELRRGLFERFGIEVAVTTAAARPFVRVSVQAYNDESDIDALVGALAALRADRSGPFR